MSASRIKGIVLVAGLVVSALTLVSWTQPWFRIGLDTEAASEGAVSVGGEVAAGGLAALGLAGLALIGALSIAGPVFRVVLAALEALIGLAVILSAAVALADPVAVSAPSITEATGITGDESLAALAREVVTTAWPFLGVVLGVATVVVGALIAITSSRWPESGRKYAATRLIPEHGADGAPVTHEDVHPLPEDDVRHAGGRSVPPRGGHAGITPPTTGGGGDVAGGSDNVADWDALSDGSDPTTR